LCSTWKPADEIQVGRVLEQLGREEKAPRATRQKAEMALCNLKLALTTTTCTNAMRSQFRRGKIIQFQFLLIEKKFCAHTPAHTDLMIWMLKLSIGKNGIENSLSRAAD
jgi:hypothetical protein